MPIGFYHFSLSGDNPGASESLNSAQHQALSVEFGSDWLYLRHEDDVLLFVARPDSASRIDVEKILDNNQILSRPAINERHLESGRAAVSRLLEIITGTAVEFLNKLSLESLHRAYNEAVEAGHIGADLQRLFQRGIWLHERVRQETPFFRFATVEEAVFCELAEKIVGTLANRNVGIIGYDPSLPRIVSRLKSAGCKTFVFLGNDTEIDDDLVLRCDGTSSISKNLKELPAGLDLLLVYYSTTHKLTEALLTEHIARKRYEPLLVFDYAKSGLNQKKLKRINRLYFYDARDVEKAINFNKAEQMDSLQEIHNWINKETRNYYNWRQSEDRFQFAGIIGRNSRMQQVFQMISRIARTDITVLIDGESGTGKELVARAVHQLSARSRRPFQVVNCGAIPDNLLESELFGHVRGAFTGAVSPKTGLFEAANSGTVFLDEIGELPPHLQVKLLRVLQDGEIKRVGGNETIRVDVRLVAATNRDLAAMVENGDFRSDLFYRLNVIQLTVPPLRERLDDVPLLVGHFIRKYAKKLKKNVSGISPEALQIIEGYHWPGNIRELENAIERSVALSFGDKIQNYDLPPVIRQLPSTTVSSPEGGLTLREMEKQYILQTLEACEWNYELASKQLAIGRTTLWRKMREYKMPEEGEQFSKK